MTLTKQQVKNFFDNLDDYIMVYEDPVSCNNPEGLATVLSVWIVDLPVNQVYARVKFQDDDPDETSYERWIQYDPDEITEHMAYIDERETFYIKRPNYEKGVDGIDRQLSCVRCNWPHERMVNTGTENGKRLIFCGDCADELLTEGRMAEENCNED